MYVTHVQGNSSTKVENLDRGLVFLKERDVLLTGDRWTVVVEIGIEDYVYLVKGMTTACNNLQQDIEKWVSINHTNKSIFSIEIHRIQGWITEINIQVQSFVALLRKSINTAENVRDRQRRGLINAGGYVLKYLFATLDHKDMDRTSKFIDNMKYFSQNIIHTQEQQLTYVRSLNERVTGNARNIVFIAKSLRDTVLEQIEEKGWFIFI